MRPMTSLRRGETPIRPRANFLIGHPVAHSLSPALYRRAYETLNLPWTYEALDLADEAAASAWLSASDYFSVNVTTPYKPLALTTATVAGASAQLAGGANLLVAHRGERLGFNVDGQGCLAALAREGFSVAGRTVAICGTGPTALSILHQCLCEGAARIVLLSRDKARSERVLRSYAKACERLATTAIDLAGFGSGGRHTTLSEALANTALQYGSYTTSTAVIAQAALIVDATTLGMAPDDPAPFDVSLLGADQWVVDTVYGHGQTALIAGARAAGAKAFDGSGMLVGQAVATVTTLCALADVDCPLTFNELFDLMATAVHP